MAIALIVANPPPIHRQALPLEHLRNIKLAVNHPEYSPLPWLGNKNRLLSNGTLIVVPLTLLSQWVMEIERFAPHLRLITLHNAEGVTLQAIASSDVVIVSTFLLQQVNRGNSNTTTVNKLSQTHPLAPLHH